MGYGMHKALFHLIGPDGKTFENDYQAWCCLNVKPAVSKEDFLAMLPYMLEDQEIRSVTEQLLFFRKIKQTFSHEAVNAMVDEKTKAFLQKCKGKGVKKALKATKKAEKKAHKALKKAQKFAVKAVKSK